MKLSDKIIQYVKVAKEICLNNGKAEMLPGNCCFMDDNSVLCLKREMGDSRYPYSIDGFTLWAHSSGYISVNESTFYVILPQSAGKEPFANFFGGIKNEDGEYCPTSILNVARTSNTENCQRYTIYTPAAAYYIADCESVIYGLRVTVRPKREVCFSLSVINKTNNIQEVYLSPAINCLLKHDAFETVETNWFRECRQEGNAFVYESVEDLDRTTHITNFGVIRRQTDGKVYSTCSRSQYAGGTNNPINLSNVLSTGIIENGKEICKFTDTPIAADIVNFRLQANDSASVDYTLTVTDCKKQVEKVLSTPLEKGELDKYISSCEAKDIDKFQDKSMLKMTFDKLDCEDLGSNIKAQTLNSFIKSVMRQVEFAALAKNSGISLLGVRDVFQQLEAALMWNAKDCRSKILEAFNFIDESGRPSRQYSIPPNAKALPRMDLRAFIDQPVWIINTVFSYLSFTNDYSLLDEQCGYYRFLKGNSVDFSDKKDSVLCHLIKMTNYMLSHIDKKTGCLKALYGDWNDALDGLGVSLNKKKEFGTGVSVMASLQLYQNLKEMSEILIEVGGHSKLVSKYLKHRENLYKGIIKNAIVTDGIGKKLLHGWGDNFSYSVGSYKDTDGSSRDGLTSNAFFIISEMIERHPELKQHIVDSYSRLDSKYGLKTFEPYFPKDMKGVGRIVNLPVGTAENAATYVHATLFGIWSQFKIGEEKQAWEQLIKILPITHKSVSSTPFVMPNSYSYNEYYGMDGESMSDWYTGSANVLIKVLVRYVFGVRVGLRGVTIAPTKFMPCAESSINIKVKNCIIKITHKKHGNAVRKFIVNGQEVIGVRGDERFGLPDSLNLGEEQIMQDCEIEVID